MDRAALLAAALLALAAAAAVGPAVGAPGDGNATDAPRYTLGQLRQPGERVVGAAPSRRWVPGGSVWVDFQDSNPLGRSGPEWAADELLRPGSTVDANELRLHFVAGSRDAGERTYTVTVVYWETETVTETVRTANGTPTTRERRVAANVTETETTVNVTEPVAVKEVPLRPHYDRAVSATMCIQPAPVGGSCIANTDHPARWAGWTHHSTRSNEGVETDTRGERLWWAISTVVVGGALSVVAFAGAGYALLRRAGAGPRMGWATYIIPGGLFAAWALSAHWDAIAGYVIAHPPVLGLALGAIAFPITVRTFNDATGKLLLLRPEVTDATTATGSDGSDVVGADLRELDVVDRHHDGRPVVAPRGFRPFVRRLLGAVVVVDADRSTAVNAGGETDHDELIVVDPDAADLVTVSPAPLALRWPATWAGAAKAAVVGAVALTLSVTAADALLGLPWLGLLPVAALAVEAGEGAATVDVAPVHVRTAAATMLVGQREVSAAKTLDATRRELWRERAQGQADLDDVLDDFDSTVLRETLPGEFSPSASGDGPLDAAEDRDADAEDDDGGGGGGG